MPRWIIFLGLFLTTLALLPLAWLDHARSTNHRSRRIQVIYDMDQQPYHRAQTPADFFADGRAMRPPVAGTVSRETILDDPSLTTGRKGGEWVRDFPHGVDSAILRRGRERFDIYCGPCHGESGRGDGMVARRAASLGEGTWTQPSDLTAETTVARPVGELFDIITRGIRKMPPYAAQIPTEDRWAIVAYLRALQRSAHGSLRDVPEDQRSALR